MATIYDVKIPTPPGVPATLDVHVTAMRRDGKALSREELAALVAAYPPPTAEARAAVERAIERAPSRPAAPRKVGGSKPRKSAAKRAAAKRPAE